jgi:anti-sigma-K factor RskA
MEPVMSENPDCGADAAAYVLGALEPAEAEAFRRHMESCVVCHDEVAALQPVAGALPTGTPQYEVPKRLRRRVTRAVRAEPRPTAAAARRGRAGARLLAVIPRPALAVATAVVIAMATLAGVELGSPGSGGSRVIQATVIGAPGTAHLRLAGGRAELIVDRLPQPDPGRIYEVWLKRPNRQPSPTSALFSVTTAGAGAVDVPGNLRGVSEVLVTQEPFGGSLAPTRSPVIVAHLA